MNRITRCPSCATVYRVDDAQLRAAGGWLRCGQCQFVFDSTGFVLFWPPPEDGFSPAADWVGGALVKRSLPAEGKPNVLDDLPGQKDHFPPAKSSRASVDLKPAEEALPTFQAPVDPSAASLQIEAQADLSAHLQEGKTAIESLRTPARWGWRATAWCLFALLTLQLLFVQRHHVVRHWPDSLSYFQNLCSTMGCSMAPPQDVEGLVIESSSLVRRPDGFLLRWTVRNTTSQTLEMSALELTLMDVAQQPVLRRTFMPSQLGAPEHMVSDQIWAGELMLQVDEAIAFTDYRLLNFYP